MSILLDSHFCLILFAPEVLQLAVNTEKNNAVIGPYPIVSRLFVLNDDPQLALCTFTFCRIWEGDRPISRFRNLWQHQSSGWLAGSFGA